MHLLSNHIKCLTVITLSIVMTGCMLGPNFHPPASPRVKRYTESPLPAKTARTKGFHNAGKSQRYVDGKDICSDWWVLFHSRPLNRLIERGLRHSPTLAAAFASLQQAQENFNVQVGNSMFPAFDATTSAQRTLFSATQFGNDIPSSIFNVFNANVGVSYTLDVWGGARRQIEALGAQMDNQQFELIAAYLTLTTNIVTTTVTIASLQEQIKATYKLIAAQQGQLDIIRNQFKLGGASYENVLTQQTLVEQTRATLPPLQKSLSQNRHALSVLVGDFPDGCLPKISLASLHLPEKIPVSFPSNLVRQRPDIRASEALVHAASAQIGVATANLFPQFTINGLYGWSASTPASLFGTTTNTWSILGQATQPIFHGGALFAARRGAIDAYRQACAQYKQTVLKGFQNVADSLRAIETDARAFRAQSYAESAAKSNLALTTKQYHLGGVSYLNLLTAQEQYEQTVLNRIQAQAARYADTAALFQALGGGWWNKRWCVKECLHEA